MYATNKQPCSPDAKMNCFLNSTVRCYFEYKQARSRTKWNCCKKEVHSAHIQGNYTICTRLHTLVACC